MFILRKRKPLDLTMNNYQAVRLPKTAFPLPETAVHQHERSGGKLKNFGHFGADPLLEFQHLQEIRENEFKCCNPHFSIIFNEIVNNNPNPFIQSIISFIEITTQLST